MGYCRSPGNTQNVMLALRKTTRLIPYQINYTLNPIVENLTGGFPDGQVIQGITGIG
jgi:hypothetical protein